MWKYPKTTPEYFEKFLLRNGGQVPKLMWAGITVDVGGEYHQYLIILELVLHFSNKISKDIWEQSSDIFTQNCWVRNSSSVWEQVDFCESFTIFPIRQIDHVGQPYLSVPCLSISFNLYSMWLFNFSDNFPKLPWIKRKLLTGFPEIRRDTWHTNWTKYYSNGQNSLS